jgi:acyl carrier protein
MRITSDSIRELLMQVVKDVPVDEIRPDTKLLERGILSSLAMLRLIALAESQFKIRIPAKEISAENFETLEAIATVVTKQSYL